MAAQLLFGSQISIDHCGPPRARIVDDPADRERIGAKRSSYGRLLPRDGGFSDVGRPDTRKVSIAEIHNHARVKCTTLRGRRCNTFQFRIGSGHDARLMATTTLEVSQTPMTNRTADRWSPGIALNGLSGPMQAIGGLFAMSADAVRFVFRKPFQWREFLEQSWFVARVSLAPTLLVAIPFTVLVSFTLNILLRELGAADLSGAGAAFGAVTQVGPLVTVLIVAGAGATAMCADLGSRTIREEIDAMEVLGINPVQRLVTPRMLASGLVALLLNSLVVIIGILGGYVFSVFVQDVNPGAFAAGITLLTGVPEVIISCVKAALFGLIAGLVACYRGLTITGGGAKAVGNAVNETVVYAFMALFVVNVVVTAIGIRMSAR